MVVVLPAKAAMVKVELFLTRFTFVVKIMASSHELNNYCDFLAHCESATPIVRRASYFARECRRQNTAVTLAGALS